MEFYNFSFLLLLCVISSAASASYRSYDPPASFKRSDDDIHQEGFNFDTSRRNAEICDIKCATDVDCSPNWICMKLGCSRTCLPDFSKIDIDNIGKREDGQQITGTDLHTKGRAPTVGPTLRPTPSIQCKDNVDCGGVPYHCVFSSDRTSSTCEPHIAGLKGKREEKCQLPSQAGPCEAIMPRWFYNSQARRCQKFDYGGCQGNDNRFGSEQECVGECDGMIDGQQITGTDLHTKGLAPTVGPTPSIQCKDNFECGGVPYHCVFSSDRTSSTCEPHIAGLVGKREASQPCLPLPRCRIFCPTGYVKDDQGCALCLCNPKV